jgi:hypothetical protein
MVSVFKWISKRALATAGPFLLAAAAMVTIPAGAQAGQFHVYSCRTPSGESAPADGWSGSKSGAETTAEDTCSQPKGALIAALGDQAPRTANADTATWTFGVPVGESVVGATLWRAGDADGGAVANAAFELWFAGPENNSSPVDSFGECESSVLCPTGVGTVGQPRSSANLLVVPNANLRGRLFVNTSCVGSSGYKCPQGSGDASGYAAVVYLYAADITLEQAAGPTADNLGGELASAPTVGGTSDVTFSASDPGSGVYQAVFSVDGQALQSTVVNEDGGRCRSAGQAADGSAAFLYLQPCPASVSADVGFDTTKVSNGIHHLVVSVTDAAGNSAPVLDRTITVYNPGAPGPPNGTNASSQAQLAVRWARTRRRRLISGYGRAETVTGQLTGPGGVPISAAQIDVLATPAFTGSRTVAMASPRTGPDGRFSLRLPVGLSSRTLRFSYRSHLGDPSPVVSSTLALTVRAGVALAISPRTASVGRSIFFRGRLRGHPIPPEGKQVVLEARSPGGAWIEFKVLRTDARGRYRARYRFKFPGPALYEFRALSEPESDYPFAAGASKAVAVRES